MPDHRRAIPGACEFLLLAGFEQVDVDAGIVPLSQFRAEQEGLVAATVGI